MIRTLNYTKKKEISSSEFYQEVTSPFLRSMTLDIFTKRAVSSISLLSPQKLPTASQKTASAK